MQQTYTATLACLIVAATWVLAVVARPGGRRRRAGLVLLEAAGLLISTWQSTQSFTLLDIGNRAAMGTGLLLGVVGAVLIEALWSLRVDEFGGAVVFVLGACSVADAYLYVMLRWAKANKLALPGKLGDYFERMSARPAVQQALKDEGLEAAKAA